MRSRALFAAALVALATAPAIFVSGCGVSVDAEGRSQTGRVWFDRNGQAWCPTCEPRPRLCGFCGGCGLCASAAPSEEKGEEEAKEPETEGEKPAGKEAARAEKLTHHVKPFTNACGKGHTVQWHGDEVPCWDCDGSGRCPACGGAGAFFVKWAAANPMDSSGTSKVCPDCAHKSGEDPAAGTGECQECEGRGTVEWGSLSLVGRK